MSSTASRSSNKSTVRKKVDSRIRTLIENGVKLRQRTMFVIVGDHGRDQVVNLHYMLSKSSVKTRPSVLWCFQKELGFTTHHRKKARKIKREIQKGIRDVDEENPFELFTAATDLRYTYYKETHKILGQTFGMCVLQDFAALTPNLLARTVETVEGGGLVVILLKTMTSLKQLFTMAMDVHDRYRTEAHNDVVGRFNERFLLSLAANTRCLVVDDELNILPISSHARSIQQISVAEEQLNEKGDAILSGNEQELRNLKLSMRDTQPVGNLVAACRTLDQAKAVLVFVEAIAEKTLRNTVVLTAARGRGKSAALGLAIAGAIAFGYSNIFVTAPSPENLKTLFDMVFQGFDALEFKEHIDYEIVQSTNPEFNKAVVRVNVFRAHRQTIQYIQPQDAQKLGQAELVVIDEAAAIPLPLVKELLGNYLVFMSSTVNGYEGTGRSLSLKLVKDLRHQSSNVANSQAKSASGGRVLKELTLEEPIRYAKGDMVESWLNNLLCLECTSSVPILTGNVPHPSKCELFYVNRDTLFSFHKGTEAFLQRMMALYVSSHYKNTPNDLQLMSDAPSHHLFVLLGPVNADNALPDILCVIQLCLEGEISKESVQMQLSRGLRSSGDLIPWCVSQQFQDADFPSLSGGRVVRIATHPDLQHMGYGARALQLLQDYFEGLITNISEDNQPSTTEAKDKNDEKEVPGLLQEVITSRKTDKPLLEALADRPAEPLHYLGTSYGLTQPLFNFWAKAGYLPVYLRQTPNDLTGEYSCIMLKPLNGQAVQQIANKDWIKSYTEDFNKRFLSLLSFDFRIFTCALALSVVSSVKPKEDEEHKTSVTWEQVCTVLSEFDLRRIESYARNLVDYHMVIDLLPGISRLFFSSALPITLSYTQMAVLLAVGLQHKSVTQLESELQVSSSQILALFNKAMRKVSSYLRSLEEGSVRESLSDLQGIKKASEQKLEPLTQPLDQEMQETAKEVHQEMKSKQQHLQLDQESSLSEFAIKGNEEDWNAALSKNKSPSASKTISVKTGIAAERRIKRDKRGELAAGGSAKKKGKKRAK